MSDPCEQDLIKLGLKDGDVAASLKRMQDLKKSLNKMIQTRMKEVELESNIPAPPRATKEKVVDAVKKYGEQGYEIPKQLRVSTMLMNPSTHGVNVTATGMQAGVSMVDETMGVLMSRMPNRQRLEFAELGHYAKGFGRAGMDAVGMLGHIVNTARKKGAVGTKDIEGLLKERGYHPAMASGKEQLMLHKELSEPRDIKNFSDHIIKNGFSYAYNTLMHLPFSSLQATDVSFKIMSYRAKVQQLLSREGTAMGLVPGPALNDYVKNGWEAMSKKVKDGTKMKEMGVNADRAFSYAQENTFTQPPQTWSGKFLTGGLGREAVPAVALSESMVLLSPFRNIYVNLMRQTFSRRLTPFLDEATRAEWYSKDPMVKQTAQARTASAYLIFAGTMATFWGGMGLIGEFKGLRADNKANDFPIKIHPPGSFNPAEADLQFRTEGTVGGTIEFGDGAYYVPQSFLSPSIGIPLTIFTIVQEGLKELEYMEIDNPQQAKDEMFMKAFGPIVGAMADSMWTTEYMGFLNKMGWAIQSGNAEAFKSTLAEVAAGPVKAPKWIQKLTEDYTGNVNDYDGFYNKFMANITGQMKYYSPKIGMGGQPIPRLERLGKNAGLPYYGFDDDVIDFLNTIDYDKNMPRNISYSISGDGNPTKNGTPESVDTIPMNAEMRTKFNRSAATIRLPEYGNRNMQETIRAMFKSPGNYDPEALKKNKKDPGNGNTTIQLRGKVNYVYAAYRKAAKELLKYNPKFKVREKQIQLFVDHQLKTKAATREEMSKYSKQSINELNSYRRTNQGKF